MSDYVRILGAIVLPNIGGFAGSMSTKNEINTWYKTLDKPWWTPPNWVFAPMWTFLYTSMGYASYLVWRDGGGFEGAMVPLSAYVTSLALNWIWSPIFFKMHKIGAAAGVILTYLGTTCVTTYLFWPVNRTASYLLMPLIGWLSLASSINVYVWMYNKDKAQ